MNSIILELQKNCISKDIKLTDLLRKAYLIAIKLDLHELKNWIKKELYGYTNQCDIPKYRQAFCELKAFNPYAGWIPFIIESKDFESSLCTINILQPISEIEKLIELGADRGRLQMPFSGTELAILQKISRCDFNINRFISSTTMNKICDSTRTFVLEWSINLEKQGILGENLLFTDEEKNKASHSQIINIYNSHFNGVLGTIENSNIEQNFLSINKGNKSDLTEALKKYNIEDSEIKNLLKVIDDDFPMENQKKIGPKVSNWIKKIVGKTANGILGIATDVTANVLTKLISQYYGII